MKDAIITDLESRKWSYESMERIEKKRRKTGMMKSKD